MGLKTYIKRVIRYLLTGLPVQKVTANIVTLASNEFKFRKFNLQLLIYKCRKYVSYLPPC